MPMADAVRVLSEQIRGEHPAWDVALVYTEVMRAQCGLGPYAATWQVLRDLANDEDAHRAGRRERASAAPA